jgi:Ran GTPase-activating protein (RanGAP) involved in mRNA processing and transport
VDQIIDRIAKTVGVNSTRFDIGVVTSTKNTPSKDISLLSLNPSRPAIRSNTLNERDAALVLKLAVLTLGTEPAVQKLVKGILLNTVRSVNLGGLTLLPETIQALSKALLVSSTVLSVLFPNTHLGDAGVVLLADAMRGNSSITNLNLEECGVGDTGVKALTQALAANKKTALVSLNLSHNTIGELGSQSLATYLEATQTLTCLNLGYSHLGAASAPFISQALRHAHITHLFLPGNDFQDEGASKFAYALNTNTHLQVFNFQVLIMLRVKIQTLTFFSFIFYLFFFQ